MLWCQDYAWHNRKFMRDLMIEAVHEISNGSAAMDESVNIHHNFCQCERCKYTVSLPMGSILSLLNQSNLLTCLRIKRLTCIMLLLQLPDSAAVFYASDGVACVL
jgi:hypothetical protein